MIRVKDFVVLDVRVLPEGLDSLGKSYPFFTDETIVKRIGVDVVSDSKISVDKGGVWIADSKGKVISYIKITNKFVVDLTPLGTGLTNLVLSYELPNKLLIGLVDVVEDFHVPLATVDWSGANVSSVTAIDPVVRSTDDVEAIKRDIQKFVTTSVITDNFINNIEDSVKQLVERDVASAKADVQYVVNEINDVKASVLDAEVISSIRDELISKIREVSRSVNDCLEIANELKIRVQALEDKSIDS